jgi:hypothetical protein
MDDLSLASTDARNMVQVLLEALEGADRVVVETRNALGEMDAHYLHAPAVLADLQAITGESSDGTAG